MTGVSLGTVKSRIHRGRLALRALLEGRMELFRGEAVLKPVTDRTPQHAEHDPFVIAQLAADDLRPSERPDVERLAAECRDCAALLDDLRTLDDRDDRTAPMPAGLRPRDFRLTEADAARLRKGGWRRVFGGLRGAAVRVHAATRRRDLDAGPRRAPDHRGRPAVPRQHERAGKRPGPGRQRAPAGQRIARRRPSPRPTPPTAASSRHRWPPRRPRPALPRPQCPRRPTRGPPTPPRWRAARRRDPTSRRRSRRCSAPDAARQHRRRTGDERRRGPRTDRGSGAGRGRGSGRDGPGARPDGDGRRRRPRAERGLAGRS